jgi:chromosome segregation ATPase
MTLEQDFEAVQNVLMDSYDSNYHDGHAALDRIRTALVDHQRFLREARAEVESLRLDIESFKRIQASAEAEVERLRFAAENAHQDIERWRAALETIQELAATSSLRVFHTIATDALAKEDA